jgi:hypothetical protein
MKKTVHSPLALGVVLLVTAALISWFVVSQQTAVKETSDIGGQGLQKVQEVKRELQLPPDQVQP